MASTNFTEIFGYKVGFVEELGRGAFGTVYKGYAQNGSVVAVKRIRTGSEEDRKKANMEAFKFHYLKDKGLQANKHIMNIFDVKYQQNAIYIIMEFCELGDLNQFFRKHHARLNIGAKVNLMKQIANGIAFLHSRDIVHRDIKPANILLTSTSDRCAVVKLGDFGLTKILDPNSLTSAMSSNVGSLAFKAPEFFNGRPEDNGKIRYHRNIDVYAAGLTFAAMLQAQPETKLLPKAEGSLRSTETRMSVGLAAHNRRVNGHPEITVVQDDIFDCVLTKYIKHIIRGMTCLSPVHRLPASGVYEKGPSLFLEECGKSTLDFFTDAVCLNTNGRLVYRGKKTRPGNSEYTITMIQNPTSGSRTQNTEWPASCDHYLPYGLLVVCKGSGASNEVLLAEGCPHPNCRVIRTYDVHNRYCSVVYENVEPHKICNGPGKTLLVCDWVSKSVLHLVIPGGRKYLCTHQLKLDFLPVQGMCYSDHSKELVFSRVDDHTVFAINLANGEKLWQMNQCNGTIDHIELRPEDVCSTPQGWICVANRTNLLFLRSSNGDLVSVQHITERDKPNSRARLRDMLGLSSDTELNAEWPSKRAAGVQLSPLDQMDDGSPQSNATSSQGFHKVMYCDSDMGPVLAVRHEERTIITYRYKLTFIPDERIVLDN